MSVKKRGISEQKPRAHSALLIREREREREIERERRMADIGHMGSCPPPQLFFIYIYLYLYMVKIPLFSLSPFLSILSSLFSIFLPFSFFFTIYIAPPPEILCSPLNNVGVRIEEDVLSSNDVVFGRCLRVLG